MLGAAKFQQFLQYEALQTLARDGSKRLEQLSSGRYKLQIDDKGAEFEVIDQWNADQARSVKTLSGGETFLASLALSLALAESLPGLAASRRVVLDSIFLDEGFGSLDPDALDRPLTPWTPCAPRTGWSASSRTCRSWRSGCRRASW